jgi:hypothetical protein
LSSEASIDVPGKNDSKQKSFYDHREARHDDKARLVRLHPLGGFNCENSHHALLHFCDATESANETFGQTLQSLLWHFIECRCLFIWLNLIPFGSCERFKASQTARVPNSFALHPAADINAKRLWQRASRGKLEKLFAERRQNVISARTLSLAHTSISLGNISKRRAGRIEVESIFH